MILLLHILWGIRMLRAASHHFALWQVKEFRWDRVRAHLQLPSARAHLFSPLLLVKWALLGWWLVQPAASHTLLAFMAVSIMYVGEAVWFGRELRAHGVRRPRVSPRIGVLVSIVAVFMLSLLIVGHRAGWPWIVTLLLADRLLPLLIPLAVLITVPARLWNHTQTIARAAQRLGAAPRLQRVGITGSMGKSSTKEFLAVLAGGSFRVLKTPTNINTDVGIAQTILRGLRDEHTLLISEMGAYRHGEIARAARLVQPRIGMITAVRDQHRALFGTPEDLAMAKGELLRALPPSGIAIVNGDDPTCVRLAQHTPAARIMRYGLTEDNEVHGVVQSVHRDHFVLRIQSGKGTYTVTIPLTGKHHASNVLAAWAAGEALDIPPETLAERTRLLRPLPRTMEPRTGPQGTFVVDDSYSANPDGVIAALEYLPFAQAKKTIVVLATMIELGPASEEAHRRVGDVLQRIQPTLTVVVGHDFTDALLSPPAAEGAPTSQIVIEPDAERAWALIHPHLGPDTLVLLEGRIPEALRKKCVSSSP
ncbi:MAG: UDP-N-acetylmuramoyl-tripeptide--D-alanyl-D-alanine ligase [Parcubacteria group bacterium Gr01-1014_106]|nr:MAG: UDP-N-acetylmuramoyl-tripeptide--D-alanyl-D-alanine ligase [Parcubacteria group bacterium Gr01-1014_106]